MRKTVTALPPSLAIISRVIAAVAGGYALATVLAIALAGIVPLPRVDAVATGILTGFAVYAAAVLWVFAARSATRAWLGLLVPTLVFSVLAWFTAPGSPL